MKEQRMCEQRCGRPAEGYAMVGGAMTDADIYKALTDAALADRLRRIVRSPRGWSKPERDALVMEAVRRFEDNGDDA